MRSLLLCLPTLMMFAHPLPINVISGEVQFSSRSNRMEVRASDQAIIEWEHFNIEPNETLKFIQPSIQSTALNRVLDRNPSKIFGRIEATGQILLINPYGIVFGKESSIDAASLIASTLDIQNECFLNQKEFTFSGDRIGKIESSGRIRTQKATFLIGHEVRHTGQIEYSKMGGILSGRKVCLDAQTFEPLTIETKHSHKFTLTEIEGSIVTKGGSIYVTGERVWLKDHSLLDASHTTNPGSIFIGTRGENDQLFQRPEFIVFEQLASINADCDAVGNGGNVYLISDSSNIAYGTISARGGEYRGDGGFVEVSGPSLNFTSNANVSASKGKPGMLYLDPTDVTIGAATCATAVIGCPTTWTVACGCPVSLSAAAITAALAGGSDVCIDTATAPNLGCAGGGNVTLIAGNDINWGSAASFYIRADNDITILSDIQNSSTGTVELDAGGNITVTANTAPVAVGSLQGPTNVFANGDITVNAGTMDNPAFIGFNITAGGQTSSNDITVRCNNLTMVGNVSGESTGAIIGHGFMGGLTFMYSANSNITVLARGDIRLIHQSSMRYTSVSIGHMGEDLIGASVLNGDIDVQAGGSIIFDMAGNGPLEGQANQIGHNTPRSTTGATSGSGNISVIAGTDIIFIPGAPGSGGFTNHSIGHGFRDALSLSGDITVQAGRNIIMTNEELAIGPDRLSIGHWGANSVVDFSGDITVSACQDIIINGGNSSGAGIFPGWSIIGYPYVIIPASITGNISVAAGRDLTMIGGIAGVPTHTGPLIGILNGGAGTTYTGDTYVSVGRNLTINSQIRGGIDSPNNVTVAVGGDITLTAGASGFDVFIGTESDTPIHTTTIYSGGNIVASNGASGSALLGKGYLIPVNGNLELRASGNIQMAADFTTLSTGTIFIEADSQFASGEFWQVSGSQVNSIGNMALPVPIPLLNTCMSTTLAVSFDGFGAFSVDSGPIQLQTLSGPITVHSAQTAVGGGSSNLNIGCTAGNDICITTSSGDIEIFGTRVAGQCQTGDAFYNVTLDQEICTSGNVLIAANNDLTLAPGSSIGGAGCAGLPFIVTLICDNQAPISPLIGTGVFTMDATSEINAVESIRIYTASQGLNTIDGMLNSMSFSPGTLFEDTCQEQWCTYYCFINNTCPMSYPFSIFYKDCLQLLTSQAGLVTQELLADLHQQKEYPGWQECFKISYVLQPAFLGTEPYFISRRDNKLINLPKTWTTILPE